MADTSLIQPSLDELLALRFRANRFKPAANPSRQSSAGQQQSHLYGRGMDYAESRAYQAGDDIRRLDWRLTARSGKLHTKLFQEDRQDSLVILLDTSATLAFGTRGCFKQVQAARAAALAAWLMAQASERVGLACFGRSQTEVAVRGGRQAALAICKQLSVPVTDNGKTFPLAQTLSLLRRPRPGRLLLVTDGFALTPADETALLVASKHSRLALLGIADVLEAELPPAGNFAVETQGRVTPLALFGHHRDRFLAQLHAGQQRLADFAGKYHLPWRQLTTTEDALPALSQLLGREVRT